MSVVFYQELLKMVSLGLDELSESIANGKTSATPVSETYFLSNWVTKAIKQQRFHPCLKSVLLSWQQQSRSMGKNAALTLKFTKIKTGYTQLLGDRDTLGSVTRENFDALCQALIDADWEVAIDYPVQKKVSHFTEGHDSFVVCCQQQKDKFNDGVLIKPISFYVRGDKKQLNQLANKHGIVLHKVTDYKSLVKYHGEYLVYPANDAPVIAELD